jgi:hypothetical protein
MKTKFKRGQTVYIGFAGIFGRVMGVQRKTGLIHVKTEKGPSSSGQTWLFGPEEITIGGIPF